MNTKIDFTDPDGPGIQPSVILNFLIKRCNEIIQSENPKVPAVLQGLGLSALGSDEELFDKYGKIISYSSDTKEEVLRSSIDIFHSALEHDLDRRSSENPPQAAEWPEMGEKFCRHVMMRAIREGRQMLEEGDFRFVQVFVLLGWISLQCDAEGWPSLRRRATPLQMTPRKFLHGEEMFSKTPFSCAEHRVKSNPYPSDARRSIHVHIYLRCGHPPRSRRNLRFHDQWRGIPAALRR